MNKLLSIKKIFVRLVPGLLVVSYNFGFKPEQNVQWYKEIGS